MMSKKYSEQDMERILSQDLPEMRWMEAKIQDTYGEIRRRSRIVENVKTPSGKRWYKAAVAAALAAVIPITGYAAAKQFGLLEFLEQRGMENEEIIILTSDHTVVEEAQNFSNQYVEYAVQEALSDGQIIYMVIEAQPKNEEYLLLPQDCAKDDDAGSWLNLPEAAGQTIQDYADSQGKELVWCAQRRRSDH